MNKEYKYDVAISFAEEDKDAAVALALAFKLKKIEAYYYPEKRMDTMGDLKEKLTNIYRHEARYAVVLLSGHYLNTDKKYVQVELAAIQSRMAEECGITYMVPVKLRREEDSNAASMQHPVFLGQTYLEWNADPVKIADLIWEALGRKREMGANSKSDIQVLESEIDAGTAHIGNDTTKSNILQDTTIQVTRSTIKGDTIHIGNKS